MADKLDKLLQLLKAGSAVSRDFAAVTLSQQPSPSKNVSSSFLGKLYPYLVDANWDTRIAATKTLGFYLEKHQFWPEQSIGRDEFDGNDKFLHEFLALDICFNVDVALTKLPLGSSDYLNNDQQDQFDINATRKELDRHIGLNSELIGVTSEEWINEDDIGLFDVEDRDGASSSAKKPRTTDDEAIYFATTADDFLLLKNALKEWICGTLFCRLLSLDLFDSAWHVRHGAALSLKEILRSHGSYLQSQVGGQYDLLLVLSCKQLFTCAVSDHFNDFNGSLCIAPVREAIAQAVGVIYSTASFNTSLAIARTWLLQFFQLDAVTHWQCVHFGLVCVKYILPTVAQRQDGLEKHARDDDLQALFSIFLPFVRENVASANEDICAACLQILLAVADNAAWALSSDYLRSVHSKCLEIIAGDVKDTANLEMFDDANETILECALILLRRFLPSLSDDRTAIWSWRIFERICALCQHCSIPVRKSALELLVVAVDRALDTAYAAVFSDIESECLHQAALDRMRNILQFFMRRLLLDGLDDLSHLLECAWKGVVRLAVRNVGVDLFSEAVSPLIGFWFANLMVSDSSPRLNEAHLCAFSSGALTLSSSEKGDICVIGGLEYLQRSEALREELIDATKLRTARAIAFVCSYVATCHHSTRIDEESPSNSLAALFRFYLSSNSFYQKCVASMIFHAWCCDALHSVESWLCSVDATPSCSRTLPELFLQTLQSTSSGCVCDELTPLLAEITCSCQNYISLLADCGISLSFDSTIFSLTSISKLLAENVSVHLAPQHIAEIVELRKREIIVRFEDLTATLEKLSRRLSIWLAAVLIALNFVQQKINPLIKPLMDCLKVEPNSCIVSVVVDALVRLVEVFRMRTPNPLDKVLVNLVTFHCYDQWHSNDAYAEPIKVKNTGTALIAITRSLGDSLSEVAPSVWRKLVLTDCDSALTSTSKPAQTGDAVSTPELVEGLMLWRLLWSDLSDSLRCRLLNLLRQRNAFRDIITSENSRLRSLCVQALVACCEHSTIATLNILLLEYCGLLEQQGTSDEQKLGVVELFHALLQRIDAKLVGAISLLAAPLIPLMSSGVSSVRQLASASFAGLVALLPLEQTISDEFCEELKARGLRNHEFLAKLIHPDIVSHCTLPFDLRSVSLRNYQLDGVSWLRFLHDYGLHGCLCDDMGLGKTLQTLCAIALDYAEQQKKSSAPSLVICPPTLVSHWILEVQRYFGHSDVLRAHSVQGKLGLDSSKLLSTTNESGFNLIVSSYDCLRKDAESFARLRWNYFVLDEGHIIKNPKTQLFKAVCLISASHRLILTGTPIQNSVLDLWSLFEVLMPGYLGSHEFFTSSFVKPILGSRDLKATAADAELGRKSLQTLHRQVLPFVLRRLKGDVLKDLPPKILQDCLCELSPLQASLYEEFRCQLRECGATAAGQLSSGRNAFQMLNYLRKLVDSPALVLNEAHPRYAEVLRSCAEGKTSPSSIEHSGKLLAFVELLEQCGIGKSEFSPHRALVFCQFKSMLDLIAQLIDSGELSRFISSEATAISYLRLDGSVSPSQRQAVADRFNSDVSVDLLLLTTQVGGLGLNLTGADVVIFVDHDYNPVRDMQAMDRAHRLGQKCTVNVFRLITRGTVEERIMSLQNFKKYVANTVINEENTSLAAVSSSQLMDLLAFEKEPSKSGNTVDRSSSVERSRFSTSAVEPVLGLDEIWNNSCDYDDAFDVQAFISSLRK